jgi:hypothetical protein
MEASLEVVGAEHEHDPVERLMGSEAGEKVGLPIAPFLKRVLEYGGASVEPLFQDAVAGAEPALENTRPANGGSVARGERSSRAGDGIITPGVGVSEAEDVFHGNL